MRGGPELALVLFDHAYRVAPGSPAAANSSRISSAVWKYASVSSSSASPSCTPVATSTSTRCRTAGRA
ncbi:hypothetical protein [Cryptosporangium arvum]|uniref:hypothetical protein n=1 Tax=Cryptosporangium arvum TaxID=80871 RepID=UPI00055F3DAC|nr:hypothetical protein [Cryptosporangium arvum]